MKEAASVGGVFRARPNADTERAERPCMTLGRPPVRVRFAGCVVPADRRQRTCESVPLPTTKRWKHMVCYANVPPGTVRGGSALNLPFLCVATTN